MFYHIDGTVDKLSQDSAVIDCNGVGFEVYVSMYTLSALNQGEHCKLYITESIGETNFDLYGFITEQEKRLFKLLTSVSGVGPKAAISILSYNSPDMLISSVLSDDEKGLTAAPGIGKKTAQRIILELKDKFSKLDAVNITVKPTAVQTIQSGNNLDEAVKALAVLGYSISDINKVLNSIDISGMNTQQIIKEVLKYMV